MVQLSQFDLEDMPGGQFFDKVQSVYGPIFDRWSRGDIARAQRQIEAALGDQSIFVPFTLADYHWGPANLTAALRLEMDGEDMYKQVNLTSSQLLNLGTTPVLIVEPQGAGKIIKVEQAMYKLNFGTTPYNNDAYVALFYGTNADTDLLANTGTDILSHSSSGVKIEGSPFTADTVGDDVDNAGIYLCAANPNPDGEDGTPSGGDGSLAISIYYKIFTF